MSRMDEEQDVFGQLTFSDFKMLSSIALKTISNYKIPMANNSPHPLTKRWMGAENKKLLWGRKFKN